MNGYFEAIAEQQTVITLAGQEVTVPRARLGLHLQLGRLANEFDNAPGSPEMAEAIRDYFGTLRLDIGGASAVETLTAYWVLRTANGWQWALAFMKETGKPKETPEPYDYPDRNWTWVVHKLASRYGWTRDYIFNLWPEEAAVYLQEIMISEHAESEERYRLSELAYKYDPSSKRSYYQPMAKPAWMLNYELPKPVRVLKAYLPFGVQTMDGQVKEYHH